MEYGVMPTINQYAENNEVSIQQIQPSTETANLSNNTKQVTKDNSLDSVGGSENQTSESSESKDVTASDVSKYTEVVLTNLNFGFDDSSRDFYVKAVRGDSESQYPTDEMMRLKAYNLAEAKAQSAAELNS